MSSLDASNDDFEPVSPLSSDDETGDFEAYEGLYMSLYWRTLDPMARLAVAHQRWLDASNGVEGWYMDRDRAVQREMLLIEESKHTYAYVKNRSTKQLPAQDAIEDERNSTAP